MNNGSRRRPKWMASGITTYMGRRRAVRPRSQKARQLPDEELVLSKMDTADARVEDDRQALKALAEYFAILREWSLKRRPNNADVDTLTDEP